MWHFNEPLYVRALAGESAYVEDQSYEITPSGEPRTHYFSVSYAPTRDEFGTIRGVLVTVSETTQRMQKERAQASLLASSMLESSSLHRLFDLAPGWLTILRGPLHVYEMANEAYFEVIGRRDIIGKSVREVLPESVVQGYVKLLDEVFATGVPHQSKNTHFRRTGRDDVDAREFFLDMLYQPLCDAAGKVVGILAMGQDTTERHRAQSKLQAFSDSVPALTWIASAQGFVEHCNRQWYAYTGQEHGQAISEGWLDALHPDDRELALCAWHHAVEFNGHYEIEYRVRRHDGVYRWFLTRAVPQFGELGEVLNWFGTSTDIDSVKKMEAALEEADHRKDQYLATLAHELRGPLAPIRNAVEALRASELPPAGAARLHDIIMRQSSNMGLLLDDLLDLSRISRGRVELRPQLVRLRALLDAAVETASPLILAKGHRLEVHVDTPEFAFEADALRLTQVLANLLTNAAKYTDRGGTIILSAVVEQASLLLSVKDDGIGLHSEVLGSVFAMFSQERALIDRSEGGLGIGLALVKSLVELHGGAVEALSKGPGTGSEFRVRLPRIALN